MYLKRIIISITLLGLGLGFVLLPSYPLVFAQDSEILWSAPINISNSPGMTSSDPFLLADPAGIAHLFWAEKVLDLPGDQTDTLMYAQWDGSQWSNPIDIFFAFPEEGNLIVYYPHAVLDDYGNIHLIWIGFPNAPNYALYYSSVPADQAGIPSAWQPRATLATDLTGTKYSIHIAYSPPQTIHIIYARVPTGDSPDEERAVTYIRSTDGGLNWSEPVDIYTIPDLDRGASDTRLLVEPPDKVFATWTEWDGTGNGQAIFFARSLDNGQTWERPIRLTERINTEYERDWNNLALLGPNQLVAMWEGGYRAYRYGMYSSDDGATWSEPIDTFPWLIGENGYAEFARDSKDRLHLFISQRIREGNIARGEHFGLWHSVWEGGNTWSEPTLSGGNNAMLNPKVALVNGNRILAAWYSSSENELEIKVMEGQILDAPEIPSRKWPTATPVPTLTPTPVVIPPTQTPIPSFINSSGESQSIDPSTPGIAVMLGAVPVFLLIVGVIVIRKILRSENHL